MDMKRKRLTAATIDMDRLEQLLAESNYGEAVDMYATNPATIFEHIADSTDRAKRKRVEQLARFHIGDVAYPLYQSSAPELWGIVVDVNVVTHKVSINLHGVVRQYDPEELVLTNPEEKDPNWANNDKHRILHTIERTVHSAFNASRQARNARKLGRAL